MGLVAGDARLSAITPKSAIKLDATKIKQSQASWPIRHDTGSLVKKSGSACSTRGWMVDKDPSGVGLARTHPEHLQDAVVRPRMPGDRASKSRDKQPVGLRLGPRDSK